MKHRKRGTKLGKDQTIRQIMRYTKLTAIRTETLERIVVRRIAGGTGCHECGSAAWLSLSDACAAGRLTPTEICQLAERGAIHSSVTNEGHLLICESTLGTSTAKRGT